MAAGSHSNAASPPPRTRRRCQQRASLALAGQHSRPLRYLVPVTVASGDERQRPRSSAHRAGDTRSAAAVAARTSGKNLRGRRRAAPVTPPLPPQQTSTRTTSVMQLKPERRPAAKPDALLFTEPPMRPASATHATATEAAAAAEQAGPRLAIITLRQVWPRDCSLAAMCVRNVDDRVLQLTRRRAFCCVLHRPTSRVIHRSGWVCFFRMTMACGAPCM